MFRRKTPDKKSPRRSDERKDQSQLFSPESRVTKSSREFSRNRSNQKTPQSSASDSMILRPQASSLSFEHKVRVVGTRSGVDETLKSKGYMVIKVLGKGAYSKVYEAVRVKDNKKFAIKIIQQRKTSDNYRNKLWPQELQVMKEITHPGIIRTKEIIELRGEDIIICVLEFAENGILSSKLSSGALTESEAKKIMVQVFMALDFMHSKGVAHRDLKLENILLDKNNNPKIADFSYSIFCEIEEGGRVKLSTTFCGTPCYFSPEILMNKPYNPLAADVWSIAVCLYIVTNNKLPFEFGEHDSSHEMMLEQQITKKWDFSDRYKNRLSPELQDLLRRMLEPDAKKRLTMKKVLKHPWSRS